MMTKTIKARVHYGADSLDLTIPAETVRENNIEPGDIFEVTARENGNLAIVYERVYSSE
jgi:bifunctional DNA-binding transcriptional regulator/antitoxin component of YhaV-PrlF toxin-antitoxin module